MPEEMRSDALVPLVLHLAKWGGAGGTQTEGALRLLRGRGGDGFLDEGIELPALGAAPQPLGRDVPALAAYKLCRRFRHNVSP